MIFKLILHTAVGTILIFLFGFLFKLQKFIEENNLYFLSFKDFALKFFSFYLRNNFFSPNSLRILTTSFFIALIITILHVPFIEDKVPGFILFLAGGKDLPYFDSGGVGFQFFLCCGFFLFIYFSRKIINALIIDKNGVFWVKNPEFEFQKRISKKFRQVLWQAEYDSGKPEVARVEIYFFPDRVERVKVYIDGTVEKDFIPQ